MKIYSQLGILETISDSAWRQNPRNLLEMASRRIFEKMINFNPTILETKWKASNDSLICVLFLF
jgi:hypothetical protein